MINTVKINENISLSYIPMEKLKTTTIGMYIHRQLKKEEASKNAILPHILKNGCKKCKNSTEIAQYLDNLYGARFSAGISKKGEDHMICFDFETISDQYAAKGEKLVSEVVDFMLSVVFDTLDELFVLGEQECVDAWNREHPEKQVESINSVNGGYGRGLDACIELVLDKIWSLKEVGISFIIIVHTKAKDVEDPITGQMYQVITANMPQKYFNAIKTKLDILGVAYIDRDIIVEKLGRKDIKGKEVTRNVISGEARKISFRSDEYNLDSKCRFPEIVSEIELDADQFIAAIQNAIIAEQAKSGKTFEETKAEQDAATERRMEEIAKAQEENKIQKELDETVKKIADYVKANIKNKEMTGKIMAKTKELGYANPAKIDKLEDAKEVLAIIEE